MVSLPVLFQYYVIHGGSLSLKVTILFGTTFEKAFTKVLFKIRTCHEYFYFEIKIPN